MHRARGKKKEKRGKGHHTAPTENRPKQTRQRKGRRPGGGRGAPVHPPVRRHQGRLDPCWWDERRSCTTQEKDNHVRGKEERAP